MAQFDGRQVSVGLGLESTPGTAVAPSAWFSQMKLGLQNRTVVIKNEGAMGRRERYNDSAVVNEFAEGPLEGKVRDITVGYLLKNVFGSVSTADNADSNAAVKDHTFDVSSSVVPPTLTFVRKDPLTNRRHALGSLDNLDITVEQNSYAMLAANVKAKAGVDGSDTVAYDAAENEFTSAHLVTKLASSTAGLGAATPLVTKSLKLMISRTSELFFPNGQKAPSEVTGAPVEVTGELVLQYKTTDLETLWFANTARAVSISLKNTDATIGAAANPELTFTMPKVRLETFTMSDDLDTVVEQTIGFTAELDLTAGYMIRALLTNTQASY